MNYIDYLEKKSFKKKAKELEYYFPNLMKKETEEAIRRVLGYAGEVGKGALWGAGIGGGILAGSTILEGLSDRLFPEAKSVEELFPEEIEVLKKKRPITKKGEFSIKPGLIPKWLAFGAGMFPGAYGVWKLYDIIASEKENKRIRAQIKELTDITSNAPVKKAACSAVKEFIADSFIDAIGEVFDDEEMEKEGAVPVNKIVIDKATKILFNAVKTVPGLKQKLKKMGIDFVEEAGKKTLGGLLHSYTTQPIVNVTRAVAKKAIPAAIAGYGANIIGGTGKKLFTEGDANFKEYPWWNPFSGVRRAWDYGMEQLPKGIRGLFNMDSKGTVAEGANEYGIPNELYSLVKKHWPALGIGFGSLVGLSGILSYLATDEYLTDPSEERDKARVPKLR